MATSGANTRRTSWNRLYRYKLYWPPWYSSTTSQRSFSSPAEHSFSNEAIAALRLALYSLPGLSPWVAPCTRAVTPLIWTNWLSSISGQRTSFSGAAAEKPWATKSFSLVESCSMQEWAQWWLVITSPSGETKLPEQPPASRTEESWASRSHCASGAKPYFCRTLAEGKLSRVHMPSSARAANARVTAARRTRCFIEVISERGRAPLCALPTSGRQGSYGAATAARMVLSREISTVSSGSFSQSPGKWRWERM